MECLFETTDTRHCHKWIASRGEEYSTVKLQNFLFESYKPPSEVISEDKLATIRSCLVRDSNKEGITTNAIVENMLAKHSKTDREPTELMTKERRYHASILFWQLLLADHTNEALEELCTTAATYDSFDFKEMTEMLINLPRFSHRLTHDDIQDIFSGLLRMNLENDSVPGRIRGIIFRRIYPDMSKMRAYVSVSLGHCFAKAIKNKPEYRGLEDVLELCEQILTHMCSTKFRTVLAKYDIYDSNCLTYFQIVLAILSTLDPKENLDVSSGRLNLVFNLLSVLELIKSYRGHINRGSNPQVIRDCLMFLQKLVLANSHWSLFASKNYSYDFVDFWNESRGMDYYKNQPFGDDLSEAGIDISEHTTALKPNAFTRLKITNPFSPLPSDNNANMVHIPTFTKTYAFFKKNESCEQALALILSYMELPFSEKTLFNTSKRLVIDVKQFCGPMVQLSPWLIEKQAVPNTIDKSELLAILKPDTIIEYTHLKEILMLDQKRSRSI